MRSMDILRSYTGTGIRKTRYTRWWDSRTRDRSVFGRRDRKDENLFRRFKVIIIII